MLTSSLNTAAAARLIRTAWPGLPVQTIRPFGAGWANLTWLVNESLVFRFPRHQSAAAAARKEIALLPQLAATLPLPVPNFRYAALDGSAGYPWPFGGYDLVPGVPLAASGKSLPLEAAPELAAFLTALHRFPVDRAVTLGVPGGTPDRWREEYARWYAVARTVVWPVLSPSERDRTAAVIEGYLEDAGNFRFQPVLLHRDLGPDHILVDPKMGLPSGVIDFEDAMVGDPAFDFCGLGALESAVLAEYHGPADSGLPARANFYRWLWPLHTIRHAVETGNSESTEAGLRDLRRQLDQG